MLTKKAKLQMINYNDNNNLLVNLDDEISMFRNENLYFNLNSTDFNFITTSIHYFEIKLKIII